MQHFVLHQREEGRNHVRSNQLADEGQRHGNLQHVAALEVLTKMEERREDEEGREEEGEREKWREKKGRREKRGQEGGREKEERR